MEVAQRVWRRRWAVATVVALATAGAVAYSLLATQWFRADAVLIPRDAQGGSGLVAQLAQFGGLADLAGLNLGQTEKQEPLGILRSKGFTYRFIQSNAIAETIRNEATLGFLPSDGNSTGLPKLVDWFQKSVVEISEDKKTGFVTISVTWTDPKVAADWANRMTAQVNAEMKARVLQESERNLGYLRGQLSKNSSIYLEQAIARLLESEMQKVMLAQGTEQYAYRVVDEARPPSRRERPKRTIIVIVAFILSLAASSLYVIAVERKSS